MSDRGASDIGSNHQGQRHITYESRLIVAVYSMDILLFLPLCCQNCQAGLQ